MYEGQRGRIRQRGVITPPEKRDEKRKKKTYSSRMEQPPPVPVTHPKVQNLAHREGIKLAGWLGSTEVTRASPASRCAASSLAKEGIAKALGGKLPGTTERSRSGGLAPREIGLSRISDSKNESDEPKDSESRRRRRSVPGDSGRVRSEQVRSGQRRVMALVAVSCSLREMGSLSVTTPHLPKAGPSPCQTPATVSESQSEASQKPARARRFPPACG